MPTYDVSDKSISITIVTISMERAGPSHSLFERVQEGEEASQSRNTGSVRV